MRELIDWIYGLLLGKLTTPPGGVGVQVSLGSGYSVENERRGNLSKLLEVGYHLITNPEWVKHDITGDGIDETFCNIAVKYASEKMGCFTFSPGQNANAMVRLMQCGGEWRTDTADRSVEHALRGGLAIAGKIYSGHGHVAIIAPERTQPSGSWRKNVPLIYNVGKRNGLMKVSEAFTVSQGEPEYFLWGQTS